MKKWFAVGALAAACVALTSWQALASRRRAGVGVSERTRQRMRTGANLEERDAFGQTVLYEEAKRGHVLIVEMLLSVGADVNAADEWGWTPLHIAIWRGHRAVARLLLESGADVHAQDYWGRTPHDLARGRADMAACALLQEYDALVKPSRSKGWSTKGRH